MHHALRQGLRTIIGIGAFLSSSFCFAAGPVASAPQVPASVVPSKTPVPPASSSLPHLSKVHHGSVTAATSSDGCSMNINTGPARNVADFQRFDIGAGKSVSVHQASAASQSVFRVAGDHPANIHGRLDIDQGLVTLAARGGVFYHEGSLVNASSLVTAAADLSKASMEKFANGGHLLFDVSGTGQIYNAAEMNIQDGSTVGFIGRNITQEGLIKGKNTKVRYATGEKVWVELDDMIGFKVEKAAKDASIHIREGAEIQTEGGDVYMTSGDAEHLMRGVIRVDDDFVDAAESYVDERGNVVFGGNNTSVRVDGKISTEGEKAGDIVLDGSHVHLGKESELNASGDSGAGHIEIGGVRPIHSDNIVEERPIVYSDTVTIEEGAQIFAQRYKEGSAGRIFMIAKNKMDFRGTANVETWGHGDGGVIELSQLEGKFGLSDMRPEQIALKNYGVGKPGQFLLDPGTFTVAASGGDITATTLENWLGMGSVIIDATDTVTISEAITMGTRYDLVLAADAINIGSNITMNDQGSLFLWAKGSTAPSGAGTIDASSNRRNFIVLSRGSGQTIDLSGLTNIQSNVSEYIMTRTSATTSISHGDHLTANVTDTTPIADTTVGQGFNLLGIKLALSGADAREAGSIVDGTQVGTLDKVSVTLGDGSSTDPLKGTIGGDSLISYLNLTFDGNLSPIPYDNVGFIAERSNSCKVFLNNVILNTGNIGSTKGNVGALIGENSAFLRVSNSTLTIGDISTTYTEGDPNIGGLIGMDQGGPYITNSTVTIGSVSSVDGHMGGLIGNIQRSDNPVTLQGVTLNIGNVLSSGSNGEFVGGLVGLIKNSGELKFNGAASTINSIGNVDAPAGSVGGLVGELGGNSPGDTGTLRINTPLTITTIGTIGSASANKVGGLVGNFENGTISISDLSVGNIGAITGNGYVGALVGRSIYGASNITLSDSQINGTTTVAGGTGNTTTVGGLIGVNSNNSTTFSNFTINRLETGNVNFFTGSDSTTNLTIKDHFVMPYIKSGTLDTSHVSWDTLGDDKVYGYMAGQLETLPSLAITDADDMYFRFWKNTDPVTTFTQWQGKLGSSLTSADAVTVDRAASGVMRLIYSEGSSVVAPYQTVQILDTDTSLYDTYDYDADNPIVTGEASTAHYVVNDAVTSAITADPDTSTDIRPDAGAGYSYTEGSGWFGTVVTNAAGDTGEVVDPETRGFSYNAGVGSWEATVETSAGTTEGVANPYSEGFSYDSGSGNWEATVETSAGTTSDVTDPLTRGYAYDSGSGNWKATVETSAGTTTGVTDPLTRGYTYDSDSTSWKATVETSAGTTSDVTDPLTRGYAYDSDSTSWKATVETSAGTTTDVADPLTRGYTYDLGSGNWKATVETSAGTTSDVADPLTRGYTYDSDSTSWKATVETSAGTTSDVTDPLTRGYAYDSGSGSWEATIETSAGTTTGVTDPLTRGYTYDSVSGNWKATVETSAGVTSSVTDPFTQGFSYDSGSTSWKATVETSAGTTTDVTDPLTRGYTYNNGSGTWLASIEGGTTATPLTEGFTYNSGSGTWLASIEGGTTTTPAAEGYGYNASTGQWLASVEPGIITAIPVTKGYTYNGTNWVASINGSEVINPVAKGYIYTGTRWKSPKIDTGAAAASIDVAADEKPAEGVEGVGTTVFEDVDFDQEGDDEVFTEGGLLRSQSLGDLMEDTDKDGTPDAAERLTGMS